MAKTNRISARAVAYRALVALEGAKRASATLRELLNNDLSGYARLTPRDKGFARELAYGVTRHRRTLRTLIGRYAKVKSKDQDTPVRNALYLGAYQLYFLDGVNDYAAVGETVSLLRSKGARGFANGVLRAMARDREGTIDAEAAAKLPAGRLVPLRGGRFAKLKTARLPDWRDHPNAQSLGLAFSCPDAVVARWIAQRGVEATRRVLVAQNEVPPLTLRILGDAEAVARQRVTLSAAGFDLSTGSAGLACGVPGACVALPPGTAVAKLPGFDAGAFIAQDRTAQEVVELLDAQPGDRVLDLCAAPGGKTVAIADRVGPHTPEGVCGRVFAHDLSPVRLQKVRENAERMGFVDRIELSAGDAQNPANLPPGPFDRALVDAPCSNSGVLRRRVEARWRLAKADLQALQALQLALLERAAALVKPGGLVVYATCSIEEDENRGVAMAFVKRHPDVRVESELQRLPGDGPGDGGYAIALRLPRDWAPAPSAPAPSVEAPSVEAPAHD